MLGREARLVPGGKGKGRYWWSRVGWWVARWGRVGCLWVMWGKEDGNLVAA